MPRPIPVLRQKAMVHTFGAFDLDDESDELRYLGTPVALQPNALKLLAYLARHPGRVIARDELQHVSGDRPLSPWEVLHCLKTIRRVLRAHEPEPAAATIEILRGRGVRFSPSRAK